jgi:hypothetical protein
MNCHEARQLADLRMSDPHAQEWAALDAHLAGCSACRTWQQEQERTRELLHSLRQDGPTPQEVDDMFAALTSDDMPTTAAEPADRSADSWLTREVSHTMKLIAACLGLMVVLYSAFEVGHTRYTGAPRMADALPSLSAGRPVAVGYEGMPSRGTTVADTETAAESINRGLSAGQAGADPSNGAASASRSNIRARRASRGRTAQESLGTPVQRNEQEALYSYGVAASSTSQEVAGKSIAGTEIMLGEKFVPTTIDTEESAGLDASPRRPRRAAPSARSRSGGYTNHRGAAGGAGSDKQIDRSERYVSPGTEADVICPPGAYAGEGVHWYAGGQDSFGGSASTERVDSSFRARLMGSDDSFKPIRRNLLGTEAGEDPAFTLTYTFASDGTIVPYDRNAPPEAVGPPEILRNLPRVEGAVEVQDFDPGDEQVAPEESPAPEPTPAEPKQERRQTQPLLIKTGNLTLRVDSYTDSVARARTIAANGGGFIADANTEERAGGALAGYLVIRCAPQYFEGLFAALKQLGKVEAEHADAADVTDQYVDLQARIHSLEITEERLHELIKSKSFMDKIESLLEVERELTRVRSEIERYTGQLRVMADRISLSTITVRLSEPQRVVPSATLSIQVDILDDATEALHAAIAKHEAKLVSGKSFQRSAGTLAGEHALRVRLAEFDAFLTDLMALGLVEQRQVSDYRPEDANAPWAAEVECRIGLTLFERTRQLPSGSMNLEVGTLPGALSELEPILAKHQAAIASNRSTRRDDGSAYADLEITVPAGQFGALINDLGPMGRPLGKAISGEAGRIVGGAASVGCKLKLTLSERAREVPSGSMVVEVDSFDTARQRLTTLVTSDKLRVLGSSSQQFDDGTYRGDFRLGIRADAMEDVVAQLEQLGRVQQRQITGLGLGDLSRVDPHTLGVISLTAYEKPALQPTGEQTGGGMRARLREALAGLYRSLGLIAYGLIVLAPWFLLVGFFGWLINRALKRRPATGKVPSSDTPPAPPSDANPPSEAS